MSVLEFELMTRNEVSCAMNVHPRTVTRWADDGLLLSFRTLGRQRRYFRLQVDAMRQGRKLTDEQLEMLRQFMGPQS